MRENTIFKSVATRYACSVSAILIISVVLFELEARVNSTTVALCFLLVVLVSATFLGRNPALLASFAAMLCFNYFFLPPIGTWAISDPQNLIAWAAFTITAIIAGELSAYAHRRELEAKRLFNELQVAFENATEAEALRQSEKLKSALLNAVTHDLRTPLTSIKASVTTLLDSEGGHRTIELNSEGRREFLNIINEETDRLNKFIESMVALARIEAGSISASSQIASVEEIIAISVDRAEPLLADHHIVVNMERDLPMISVDARSVAEAVYNLLDNAAKYSPAGSTVSVDAYSHGNRVLIAVSDEGRGIPTEMRERVFEKFVRLDHDKEEGLGLGLSITRGIIEAQGGSIEIRDGAASKGTQIVLMLPVGEK